VRRTNDNGVFTDLCQFDIRQQRIAISDVSFPYQLIVWIAELNVGAMPICGEDNRLKGMLTDRDIAVKVVARPPLEAETAPDSVSAEAAGVVAPD